MSKRFPRALAGAALAALVGLPFAAAPAAAATFTVNSANDVDDTLCDGTHCSLREAITAANGSAGADTIAFAIGSGIAVIQPLSALPAIGGDLTVDGATQPGFPGTPLVEIRGGGVTGDGLAVSSGFVTLRSLSVTAWGEDGIDIAAANATLVGCRLGVDPTGVVRGNTVSGLRTSGNFPTVDGTDPPFGPNVISGNGAGIIVEGNNAQIWGNYIGVTSNGVGSAGYGNLTDGIRILGTGNNVGSGFFPQDGNVVSGNANGVRIMAPGGANLVRGNRIGTNAAGNGAVGNGIGVRIDTSSGNQIGGGLPTARNIISANALRGVQIDGGSDNVVEGNYIGTDISGTADLGNVQGGVVVLNSANNRVGAAGGAGNVISGNDIYGVKLVGGATGNQVLGNLIGTDRTGFAALGNAFEGVLIEGFGTTGNTIGGGGRKGRNVISANQVGVALRSQASGNTVIGNYIGTTANGFAGLGNFVDGIVLEGATGNFIGTPAPGAGNLISGNAGLGVRFAGGALFSTGNLVQGNLIGTDVTGRRPLANTAGGVRIDDGNSDNTIGGFLPAAKNVIAFNTGGGVLVVSGLFDPVRNAILGNSIFGNATLGIDLGDDGIDGDDVGDGDTGPNDRQNTLGLSLALSNDGATILEGYLGSAPSVTYRLEFFASPACDPSGHGEGRFFVGSTPVGTNASGDASFATTLPRGLPSGFVLAATVTDPSGNTSEFSGCQTVVGPPAALFGRAAAHLTGDAPVAAATADFNGDGNLDVISADDASNELSLIRGNGDGTFLVRNGRGVGAKPAAVAVADFDGDGVLDLLSANSVGNDVSFLRGLGAGAFAAAVSSPAGSGPTSVAIGDVDGDGIPDLVVARGASGEMGVLRGNGDGTFLVGPPIVEGGTLSGVVLDDFDGDGALDVAASKSASGELSVRRGNGDGTFLVGTTYPAGAGAAGVAAGDVSGDGISDLVVPAKDAGEMSVLRGNGDGTFIVAPGTPLPGSPSGVALADLDADGDLDIAAADEGGGFDVLRGNGDGTFLVGTGGGTTVANGLAVGDFDGNGLPDLALVETAADRLGVRLNGAASFGDFDESGSVAATDLVLLANLLVGNVQAGVAPFVADVALADLDIDGSVSAVDLVLLANYLVGNISRLPLP